MDAWNISKLKKIYSEIETFEVDILWIAYTSMGTDCRTGVSHKNKKLTV